MPWARFDDDMPENPKLLAADPAARLLFIDAVCWSNRHATDGQVPVSALPLLGSWFVHPDIADSANPDALADRLVAAGLWITTLDGWEIHDFHDYQPAREEILAGRAKKAANVERWKRQGRNPDGTFGKTAGGTDRTDSGTDSGPPPPPPPPPKSGGREGERSAAGAKAPPPAPPAPPADVLSMPENAEQARQLRDQLHPKP